MFLYVYHARRVLHGQRLQQDGIDHAEDRSVRANAQRQRQHRHRREAGILRQHAQTVLQVLEQSIHSYPQC